MDKANAEDKPKLAEGLGFCPGVKRAIRLAEETLKQDKEVYVIGDLIHNEGEMQRLKELGLRIVEDVKDIPGNACMLVRAHGSSPQLLKRAMERGIEIIDCTCSRVRRAQMTAVRLYNEGREILIFGDKEHPEVRGILGYIEEKGWVIENEEEAEALPNKERAGLLCQTTKGGERFLRIAQVLAGKIKDFKFEDTSCPELEKRRIASRELAREVDIMLIVGGTRSANTKRLKEDCEDMGIKSYLVERAEDLKEEWFEKGKRVGITAGLSTPLWEIREVEKQVRKMSGALWGRKRQ